MQTESEWLRERLNEVSYAIVSDLEEMDGDAKYRARGSHEKYEEVMRDRIANKIRPYFDLISNRS